MYEIKGRICIVTGSGRGIGRAIAIKLAMAGGKVVVNVRKHVDEGMETLKEINSVSEGILSIADVSTDEGRKQIFSETIEHFGTPDILVNNAGIGILEPFGSIQSKSMDTMFNTNLYSPIWLSREFMDNSRGGIIINMASLAGISPFAGLSIYGMTKAALIALTKYLALELAPSGIRVNAVAPGVVKTRMGDSLLKMMDMDENNFSEKFTLTGKLIEPDEVAETVLFLIRNESITGQVITIDSGAEQMTTDYFR
jgi:3-oxoacyl-[acyl-carrier protein] reductase